ncbi:MAG: hypothetical protein Phog2KO_39020 [Phototrophicaceae bacterium]
MPLPYELFSKDFPVFTYVKTRNFLEKDIPCVREGFKPSPTNQCSSLLELYNKYIHTD